MVYDMILYTKAGGNTRTRSRARGEREPAGRTKAAILLYLTEHGESTFTEIREHLLDRHNIRSQKDIRGHLNDLADQGKLGLIVKQSNGNGNACSYRIRDGFGSLRKLYNYLKVQDLETALMQTRHFHEYTASCDFFVQVKTSLLCDVMLDLARCMATEEGTASILQSLDHVAPEHRVMLTGWMARVRRREIDDPVAGSFVRMIDDLCSPEADMAAEAYVQKVMKRGLAAICLKQFSMLASDIIIPEEYRERITAIMRLSPGAFDCIANLNCDSPLFIRNPFLPYVISVLLAQDEPMLGPHLTLQECCDYAAGIPRLTPEPPVFTIARSHFITDLAGRRLAVKNVPPEMLRLILAD